MYTWRFLSDYSTLYYTLVLCAVDVCVILTILWNSITLVKSVKKYIWLVGWLQKVCEESSLNKECEDLEAVLYPEMYLHVLMCLYVGVHSSYVSYV